MLYYDSNGKNIAPRLAYEKTRGLRRGRWVLNRPCSRICEGFLGKLLGIPSPILALYECEIACDKTCAWRERVR